MALSRMRRNTDMKKWFVIYIFLFLALFSASGEDNKEVTADVKTSVSGYLIHGFLDTSDNTLRDTATIPNALGKSGVDLYYTIRTNQRAGLIVYASITPFEQQVAAEDKQTSISIDSVMVDGKIVTPVNGLQYISNDQSAFSLGAGVTEENAVQDNRYQLINFDSTYGQNEYTYVIHITANQREVSEAPAGQYIASVTLSLMYKD